MNYQIVIRFYVFNLILPQHRDHLMFSIGFYLNIVMHLIKPDGIMIRFDVKKKILAFHHLMKQPWATPNGATHKTCYPFQKNETIPGKKKIKISKTAKKYSKISLPPKKRKNCKKTFKNTRKRKRERSGSEAAVKKTMENREKNVEISESASFPLRSGSVPASSPWSLNATMIISMSRCQGLLPRKNHQKTRVVYQGQFTHQKIHQVVATKKSP